MNSIVAGVTILLVLLAGGETQAQSPNTVRREDTMSGTVERINRQDRTVVLRTSASTTRQVYVEPAVTILDDLRVGDLVTVRYIESVVADVRPGAKLSNVQDTTEQARKAGGDDVYEQLRAVVTIENIDSQGLFVTYRTADNRKAMYAVKDKAILAGIKPGDRVEITLTRARAVSIERKR